MHCQKDHEEHINDMRQHLLKHVMQYSDIKDTHGLELSGLIRMVANEYSTAISKSSIAGELSGPRMGVLLRLMVVHEKGMTDGINPTDLSRFQNVKKNTISSLLSGLEDAGLVERMIDPNDKRAFKIRITNKGIDLLKEVGPKRLKLMNDLSSGLSNDDMQQLLDLLKKLHDSIKQNSALPGDLDSENPDD